MRVKITVDEPAEITVYDGISMVSQHDTKAAGDVEVDVAAHHRLEIETVRTSDLFSVAG